MNRGLLSFSLLTSVMVLSSASFAAGDNTQGFQAARELTGQAMGDKQGFGGKVTDVIEVPNYTYVELAHGKNKLWLATSKADVKKGDYVSFADGQAMHKFHSKTLNRTFDEIYFVNDIEVKR